MTTASCTNYDNGDSLLKAQNSDDLLELFEKHVHNGGLYVPESVSLKNIYSPYVKLRVTRDQSKIPHFNMQYDFVEFDNGTAKLIARSTTSFFKAIERKVLAGFKFTGDSRLTPGAYSCSFVKDGIPLETPKEIEPVVQEFLLEKAYAFEDKDKLIAYCAEYGISLDKRKSLAKLKNELKTKVS